MYAQSPFYMFTGKILLHTQGKIPLNILRTSPEPQTRLVKLKLSPIFKVHFMCTPIVSALCLVTGAVPNTAKNSIARSYPLGGGGVNVCMKGVKCAGITSSLKFPRLEDFLECVLSYHCGFQGSE